MTLGEKIRLTRTQRKISQQELGELATTHQKNISKYEKDLVAPSAITLKKIADALEVTTDYLLNEKDTIVIKDTALMDQFKEIDSMPENVKNTLMSVVAAYIRDFKTKEAYK